MTRLRRWLAPRAPAFEALVGAMLIVAGVWQLFSVGAALLIAGVILLLPIVGPWLARRG